MLHILSECRKSLFTALYKVKSSNILRVLSYGIYKRFDPTSNTVPAPRIRLNIALTPAIAHPIAERKRGASNSSACKAWICPTIFFLLSSDNVTRVRIISATRPLTLKRRRWWNCHEAFARADKVEAIITVCFFFKKRPRTRTIRISAVNFFDLGRCRNQGTSERRVYTNMLLKFGCCLIMSD